MAPTNRRTIMTLTGLCLALAACNNHAVEDFEANVDAEHISESAVMEPSKVDILWIVDNSGSMCEEQANLRENFEVFINELDRVGANFRLAVVTTDVEDPRHSGRFQNQPNASTSSLCGEVPPVSHCPGVSDGGPYASAVLDSANYRDEDGTLDVESLKRDFGCNATVGVDGSGFEQGLEAARLAFSPDLLASHNSGFLRDDAYLALMFITDENDCSDGGVLNKVNGNICEWEADRLIAVEEFVDFFKQLKADPDGTPRPDKIITAGIFAPDIGVSYDWSEEVEPTCITPFGTAFSGGRYQKFVRAFEDHAQSNICEPPFEDALGVLAKLIRTAVSERCLPAPPETCESDADCGGGVCAARGQATYCEAFEIRLEMATSTPEDFDGPCETRGDDVFCQLQEGPDGHYTVDYGASCPHGVSVNFNEGFEVADQLIIRYPSAVDLR